MQMSDGVHASGPRGREWFFVIAAAHLLLVWMFSPIWLAVLVTAFWLLVFAYGVNA
jgi:hypothetical protein